MKKIIFWGDGLLAGLHGYGELLENHVFLHHPRADVSMSVLGRDGATLADALREAPLHAIGKDPDLLYLAFGHSDLAAGREPEEVLRGFQDLTALLLQKSHARLCVAGLVPAFFPEGSLRERCRTVNRGLRDAAAATRVSVIDLEAKVESFLREHRESPGDQRALHLDSGRLTPLGQLHLAHHAYRLVSWPGLQPAVPHRVLHQEADLRPPTHACGEVPAHGGKVVQAQVLDVVVRQRIVHKPSHGSGVP